MQKVRTVQSRSADNTEEYIPAELKDCDYVFLRTDSARKGLQRPYTGPYEVIARRRHSFTIKTNNGHETVAIHRLKPARVDKETIIFDIPKRRGRPRKNRRSSID